MASIERRILFLRGRRVLLSADLSELFRVRPKALIQAVKRNPDRFPADFMFQLTLQEAQALARPAEVSLRADPDGRSRSQIVTLKRGSNVKHPPYAFTQEGVAMLSSVLRSSTAIKVNIEIMRAFVRLRYGLAANKGTLRKMVELERRIYGHDAAISHLFDLITELKEEPGDRRKIGFVPEKPDPA